MFAIIFLFILVGCTYNTGDETFSQAQYKVLKTLDLEFKPLDMKVLVESKPNTDWIKGKSVYYGDLPGQKEATISFYLDTQSLDNKDVYAYLEVEDKTFEIGNISCYGLDGLETLEWMDLTNDGISEIYLSGSTGSTCLTSWVIGNMKGQWVKMLDYSNIDFHDLDADGSIEMSTTSRGSLPGFVEVLRWNGECFEIANIADQTKNMYARLKNDEQGRWIIEAGKVGKENKPHNYIYMDGKLAQIKF